MLLLRFPKETRSLLDQAPQTPDSDSFIPANENQTQEHYHHKTMGTPSKKSRWKWKLILFVLFMSSIFFDGTIYLLEHKYQSISTHVDFYSQIHEKQQEVRKLLQKSKQSENYNSLPKYLKIQDELLQSLHVIQKELCPLSNKQDQKQQKPRWNSMLRPYKQKLELWQAQLWQLFGSSYLSLRDSLELRSTKQGRLAQELCGSVLKEQLLKSSKQLKASSLSLLKQAKVHLGWYQWCSQVWSKYQFSPTHQHHLETLRQKKCKSNCRRYLSSPKPSYRKVRLYLRILRKERLGRCHKWGKHPAWNGAFHLGSYFWRVKRALSYTSMLEKNGICDPDCQELRKKWGIKLTFHSSKSATAVYLKLWSDHAKAPSQTLRRLNKKPIAYTDGKTHLLPAIRYDLMKKPYPRNAWYFLHAYNKRTKQRDFTALAPFPGKEQSVQFALRRIQRHSDGREQIEHLTVSADGSFLAFNQRRLFPWESFPSKVKSSFCPRKQSKSKLGSWNNIVHLYSIGSRGSISSKSHRLPTKGRLYGLRLSGIPGSRILAFSRKTFAQGKTVNPFAQQPRIPHSKGISAWKYQIELTEDPIFQRLQQLSTTPKGYSDVVLTSEAQKLFVARFACPLPSKSFSLFQFPPEPSRLQFAVPKGLTFLHAAFNFRQFALLVQDKSKQKGEGRTTLLLYSLPSSPWSENSRLEPKRILLNHSYTQVQGLKDKWLLAGGPWNTPLLLLNHRRQRQLLKARKNTRYIDPMITGKRLFVLQQNKVQGQKQKTSVLTFLLSKSM